MADIRDVEIEGWRDAGRGEGLRSDETRLEKEELEERTETPSVF